MAYHIFDYGPAGRHILVDGVGRLVVNADASTSGFIYAYGDTGYPVLVDGAGRLLINPSGLATGASSSGVNSVIAAGPSGWTWDAGESLYRADVAHGLGNQFVVLQCYDPATLNNVEPDHWTLTDANNVRIWSSTSGSLGVSIR